MFITHIPVRKNMKQKRPDFLVRQTEFISLEYKGICKLSHVWIEGREAKIEHDVTNDRKDVFYKWLWDNTIRGGSESYVIMGEGGVYCKITEEIRSTEGEWDPVESLLGRFENEEKISRENEFSYNRIIHIKSMPKEKDLPRDLCAALKIHGYEERSVPI